MDELDVEIDDEVPAAPITLADIGIVLLTPIGGLAQGIAYAVRFAQLALGGHSRWVYERKTFKRDAGAWIEAMPLVDEKVAD